MSDGAVKMLRLRSGELMYGFLEEVASDLKRMKTTKSFFGSLKNLVEQKG